VLGDRVPGAADGDEGQAFILHAPAANLPPQHMHMTMVETVRNSARFREEHAAHEPWWFLLS
jgi:hypothetical protein